MVFCQRSLLNLCEQAASTCLHNQVRGGFRAGLVMSTAEWQNLSRCLAQQTDTELDGVVVIEWNSRHWSSGLSQSCCFWLSACRAHCPGHAYSCHP